MSRQNSCILTRCANENNIFSLLNSLNTRSQGQASCHLLFENTQGARLLFAAWKRRESRQKA
uniref:Uncharacterized protein n=1 Tax=Anguilla anguilla TaxID=7936 RepID=A0A0E9W7A3_ANGAN